MFIHRPSFVDPPPCPSPRRGRETLLHVWFRPFMTPHPSHHTKPPRGTFHANWGRRAGQMLHSPPMDISDGLLALAGAVAPDGGRAVGQTLRALLQHAAPFDAAEAVLRRREGWAYCRLDDGEAQIAGEDVLAHVVRLRAPLRLDDLPEAAAFPETHRRLSALNLRSLLAIPFSAGTDADGAPLSGDPAARRPEGAGAPARRFGWAFAVPPLHFHWPVAGLAGRAFELEAALGEGRSRADSLRAEAERARAEAEELRAQVGGLRANAEAAREQLESRGREAAETDGAREAAEEEVRHWRAEADRLRERLAAAQADHDAHVRTLRQDLEAAHRAASDKAVALAAAEERCRELEARLAEERSRGARPVGRAPSRRSRERP